MFVGVRLCAALFARLRMQLYLLFPVVVGNGMDPKNISLFHIPQRLKNNRIHRLGKASYTFPAEKTCLDLTSMH